MQPVIIRIFFYISFFPSDLRKNRVACSFETPSLIVESFKIITRSEMFVAAYQSPGFRYELFNTGYLERSRQLADSWNVIYAWRYPTENSPIIRRRNFQVSRFPLIITDIITCRFSGKRKKKNKNRPVLEISLYSKSRIGTITSAYFSLVSLSENVKRFPSRDGDPILHVLRVPVCGVRDCDRRPLH